MKVGGTMGDSIKCSFVLSLINNVSLCFFDTGESDARTDYAEDEN